MLLQNVLIAAEPSREAVFSHCGASLLQTNSSVERQGPLQRGQVAA